MVLLIVILVAAPLLFSPEMSAWDTKKSKDVIKLGKQDWRIPLLLATGFANDITAEMDSEDSGG